LIFLSYLFSHAFLTLDEFKNFFSKYGKVAEHEIIRDHVTKRSRGFGFIVFDSEKAVDNMLANGNMIDMEGIQVSFVQSFSMISDVIGHFSLIYKAATRCCTSKVLIVEIIIGGCFLSLCNVMQFLLIFLVLCFLSLNLSKVRYRFLVFL
jgi:hypothetical protein